ncbi:MAG: asparagine--tRNA ligase [Oligoflexia bacterium]|nr:asparagine--tRNA ligase [Oligoflexia bacterium]
MKVAYIRELGNYIDSEVTIRGWIYNTRSSGKKIRFMILRDGTGLLQGVLVQGNIDEKYMDEFDKLTQETSVEVTGVVRKDERAVGGVELGVSSYRIISGSVDFPISPKEHGTAFLMENRHLWLRSKKQAAIMRIRARVIKAMKDYLDNNGFVGVESPILTPSACEGTSTLFSCDYFGEKAYLSQSGQLYAEATAFALGKVYTYGPTFRAEKSKTRRHLTEFWMLEPEMAFYDLEMDMELIEDFVEYVISTAVSECKNELAVIERDISTLLNIKKPFPRITYSEAADILEKECDDFVRGGDFGGGHETVLAGKFEKPVFIYNMPKNIKAFYFKKCDDPGFVKGCDLIAPEGYGEIVGGGQREDNYDALLQSIKEHGLNEKDYDWYLDLRKYGSVPHAGFGIGIERTVAWICGIPHLRETIAFPRMLNLLKP